MERTDDIRDIRGIAVDLQALVDDVDRVIRVAEVVDAGYGQAGLEFLEYLARHDLVAFAGLIILVDRFLGGDDGGVARESGFIVDVLEAEIAFREKGADERDCLIQILHGWGT